MTVAELNWELRILEMAVRSLRAKVNELLAKEQEAAAEGRPMKFTDLEGLWKGADRQEHGTRNTEHDLPCCVLFVCGG